MSQTSSSIDCLLVERIPLAPPAVQVFRLIKERISPFYLDSAMCSPRLGRYSFMGSDPFLVMTSRGRQVTLAHGGITEVMQRDPFDVLAELLREYRLATSDSRFPFAGGAVGYFSYDLCHFIENVPAKARDDLHLPELYLAFYDTVLAFDHIDGSTYVASTGFPEKGGERRLKAERCLAAIKTMVAEAMSLGDSDPKPLAAPCREVRSNFTREAYLRAVEAAREYICAGDIFQVNLSQRFEADLAMTPYELYSRLRRINPAPFGCYLGFGDVAVASASPERFLRLQDDLAETRPIKGTRPRGQTYAEDVNLASKLLESAKDRAEHIMIVDLERNDLGRVCRYGTIKVSELAALEKYATVFHLTSTVEGRLRPDKGGIDLLRACFPGGSITGAPKVRAMEIIDELEPTRRSVYTGSIGYLGFDGNMDLNIAIRTIVVKGGKAYFQVGGGIVYDSDPEAEYDETLDKAKALIQALTGAGETGTMT